MKRISIVVASAMAAATSVVLATPAIHTDFNKIYKVKPTSALGKLHCSVCHAALPALNAYGTDLKNKGIKLKTNKKITPAVFKAIEGLDSDKDGVKNGVELRAGTAPGDAKLKPAKKPK